MMHVQVKPRILAAEKLANAVMVTFDDGICAVFSAALLHDSLTQADRVLNENDLELDE